MKIMVIVGQYPPEEHDLRRRAIEASASPGTEIVLGVIGGTVFRRSNSEVNALVAGPLVAAKAQEGERAGVDAVVPFGTLDIGVELARHLVRIPVVGAAQATLHVAAMLSRRVGVISYEQESIPFLRKNAYAWGLGDIVVSYQSIDVPLVESLASHDRMRTLIVEAARRAMDDGAEIIFPQGVTMVPVHYPAREIADDIGIPVLDSLAISIQTAEMMARTGLSQSPLTYPPVGSL
jgi:allantoin racemase